MEGMNREEALLLVVAIAKGKAWDLEAQYDDTHDYGIYTRIKEIEDAIEVLDLGTGRRITT